MGRKLNEFRSVYAVGIGFHRYQYASETTYVTLGLTAVRQALRDARIDWESVESSYVASVTGVRGRSMLRHLGALGRPLVHVDNASASGSAAFRLACIEVAAGVSDVALAVGVDKAMVPGSRARPSTGIPDLLADAIVPATRFALLADTYARRWNAQQDDIALVALKNHANAALNSNAQRQKSRTLEEILQGKPLSGSLTPLQCAPIGEGAAAVIVASEDGIKRFGIDATRAVRVASSAAGSERADQGLDPDTALSAETIARAILEAQVDPRSIDVMEVHDAFTVEEALYAEAAGICGPGEFIPRLKQGEFEIGGKCAISASGGLIAMGHPGGPTGIGQINEIVRQLRGEASARQHMSAKTGLAHMVGVGAVCYVHVLQA